MTMPETFSAFQATRTDDDVDRALVSKTPADLPILGVDPVQTPIERRPQIWERLGGDPKPAGLDDIATEIRPEELDAVLDGILEGAVTGRNIVDLRRS